MSQSERWSKAAILACYDKPFSDLLLEAQQVHRANFVPNQVQLSQLLSIKTGACPEDCSYCSQSGHHNTGIRKEKLLDIESVVAKAKAAKASGATRFCMGGGWRSPPKKNMPQLAAMVREVKALGLETCLTAGMLDQDDAEMLNAAGLDYYNHNIDTSPEFYGKVVTTRTFDDRLQTLSRVQQAGIKTCCGGIMGLGESKADRISFIHVLANMSPPPTSVPINRLIAVPGTPLSEQPPLDDIEFVRTIATARITMPESTVRLSAGRDGMSDALQALCFVAGANSLFLGDTLLTAANPEVTDDNRLMSKLGLTPEGQLGQNSS